VTVALGSPRFIFPSQKHAGRAKKKSKKKEFKGRGGGVKVKNLTSHYPMGCSGGGVKIKGGVKMIKSVYYHTNLDGLFYSRGQVNENQRICGNTLGSESGVSRGLVREVVGCVDPVRDKF
jgi:hypothetical protein